MTELTSEIFVVMLYPLKTFGLVMLAITLLLLVISIIIKSLGRLTMHLISDAEFAIYVIVAAIVFSPLIISIIMLLGSIVNQYPICIFGVLILNAVLSYLILKIKR